MIAVSSVRPQRRHFIVIGSMKSGTTALYRQLLSHPQLGMSRFKETNYFVEEKNWSLGRAWYEAQFDQTAEVTGEVSPAYTKRDIFGGVPERIYAYQPQTKLIFIARDPVERFVSHYRHARVLGHTDVGIDELLTSHTGQHILETSRYAAQLQSYLDFFPREQICVVDFAELTNTPQISLDRITRFLGLVPIKVAPSVAKNEIGSIAAMPKIVQRLWQHSSVKRLDSVLSQRSRDVLRRVLSVRKVGPPLSLPPQIRAHVAEVLREDARKFREIAGLPFDDWLI